MEYTTTLVVTAPTERMPHPWMETGYSPQALEWGRQREREALDNENHGERDAPGTLTDRRDAISLRGIAAAHQRVFPGPHADGLEQV